MALFPLYIDPGTGSALFSILIGAAATLYFVSRAAIIKIKVILSAGKTVQGSAQVHPYVVYCEGKQYWNVFKPVLDEFENRHTPLVYLTSAEDDPVFEAGYKMVKPEYIGEDNKAYARLNLLSADFVLMTTPGLNVYQLKRSKLVKHYSHVLHAATDSTMYRLFGIDYFDSILLTGDYQASDIRVLEKMRGLPEKQLVTVGCTYLDLYAEKIKTLPRESDHVFTVLISPSWGPSALLSRYGEALLDPLSKTGWRVIIRPHPQSRKSEKTMLDNLTAKYKDIDKFEWDYERENIYSLSKADIMISDFSGIIYDYLFLCDKPVMYVDQNMDLRPYDADDLGPDAIDKMWQFKTLRQAGIELKEDMFAEIDRVIQNISDNTELKNARRRAREEGWMHQGEAGKLIADFMIQTVN
jgi:hypothetical protein